MEDISLHVLDIAENGVRAGAKRIDIRIEVNPATDRLTVEVRDDGAGMTEEEAGRALDPFCTTKTTRKVGLGIPLLAQASKLADGDFDLESAPGRGTRIRAEFRLSHIDRKPLGDLAQTFSILMAGNPGTNFRFLYKGPGDEADVDTADLREEGRVEPWDLALLSALRVRLEEEIQRVNSSVGGVV